MQFADLLGGPSDFPAWRRLISFLLRRISDISVNHYPDVLSVFEVWQNALADLRNGLSFALLTRCAEWLRDLDALPVAKKPDANSARPRRISAIMHKAKPLTGKGFFGA